MKKLFFLTLISLFLFSVSNFPPQNAGSRFAGGFRISDLLISPSHGDELDDVSKKLTDEQRRLAELEAKKQQLAKDIASASSSLAAISSQLEEAEAELASISAALAEKEEILAKWEKTRNFLIRQAYKLSRVSALEIVFSSDDFADATKKAYYHEKSLDDLKERIKVLSEEILVFRQNKEQAEKIHNDLANLRAEYLVILSSRRSAYYATTQQVNEVVRYVQHLSERQKQLLLEKFGVINVSTGDVPPVDDPKSSPDYDPGLRPALAAFTFGSYHRVGMSQYGAYGRAKDGQDYKSILGAYFNAQLVNYPVPDKINVQGYGEISFEGDYLLGISEMPRSWSIEALKAQAVAARTYALDWVRKHPGQAICTTQACQVYKAGRGCGEPYDKRWCDAVKETEGEVLVDGNGNPITAWYSSTSGGYLRNSGDIWVSPTPWTKFLIDTRNSDPNKWYSEAYENLAGSPWFYKAWYKGKYPSPHPWLNRDQMNDILNSILLYIQNPQQHLRYLSAPDWCERGDPACDANNDDVVSPDDWYSFEEVRSKLADPVDDISSVTVVVNRNQGFVEKVKFVVEGGRTIEFTGLQFLAVFNVRAPGGISIRSAYSYPLFDLKLKK